MSTTTYSRLAIVCALCAFVCSFSALAQPNAKRTEGLVRESEVIVAGKVGNVLSEWTPKRERIQTRVTITVDETIKGAVPGNAMTIIVPGGEVGGVGELYTHMATFKANEEVVVFAKKDAAGRYRVSGGNDGKFTVEKDARTGAKTIRNFGTLEAFKSAIAKSINAPRGGK